MSSPPNISLTVLANGFDGSAKSLLIDCGRTRYLVNCGEGTQRILFEYRSKASKIQHAFFSQMSWDHVSGLLGVALTAKMAGVKTLTVHGPKSIEELMQVSRHFADSETTEIVASDILSKPFVDGAFKVHAFPISLAPDNTSAAGEPESKRIKTEEHHLTTYAYYFQTFQQRRKLDTIKCRAMGIPGSVLSSSAIRDVVDGGGITLADGRFIPSEFVTYPSYRVPNFLVIDCPTLDLIPRMESTKPLYDALITQPIEEKLKAGVSLIVHLLPQGMFTTKEYQSFIRRLTDLLLEHTTTTGISASEVQHPDALQHPLQHLVVDGSGCIPSLSGIYSQSTILHHYFDAVVYPKLYNMKCETRKQLIKEAINQLPEPFCSPVYAQPQIRYLIRPWAGFKFSDCPILEESALLDGAFDPLFISREEAEAKFAEMHSVIERDLSSQTTPAVEHCSPKSSDTVTPTATRIKSTSYPVLTFLGTGSSSPNKYRNISCILVQLSSDDYILLDCGEGSLNQLYALYGPDGTQEILQRLRLVLVTHMHADHHGGLFSIALARSRLLTSLQSTESYTLPVLTPPGFTRWMTSFQNLFFHGPVLSLFVIPQVYQSPCPVDTHPPVCPIKSEGPFVAEWVSLLDRLQLEVHPVKVPHTGSSWAFLLRGNRTDGSETRRKWSVVYSGDTPECMDLAEAGQDCDLLIHEATMIDEHKHLADKAKHSTVGTAVRIGEAMNASFMVLNHFSQRYGRLPCTDTFRPNVFTAFDFMQIRLDDLKRLSYYVPYYKYAFAKHWEQQKTMTESFWWRKLREQTERGEESTEALEHIERIVSG